MHNSPRSTLRFILNARILQMGRVSQHGERRRKGREGADEPVQGGRRKGREEAGDPARGSRRRGGELSPGKKIKEKEKSLDHLICPRGQLTQTVCFSMQSRKHTTMGRLGH
jgi:hypothetical protein